MNRAVFEQLVADALTRIPRRFRNALTNLVIVVEDEPSLDLLQEIQQTGDIFFPKNWMDALLDGHNSREAVDVIRAFLDEHPQQDSEKPSNEPAYPVRLRRIILQSADDLFRAPDIVVPGS